MATSLHLLTKLSNSLTLTPRLTQAIGLLQLNNLELSESIEKELLENPFLTVEDSGEQASENGESPGITEDSGEKTGYGDAYTGRAEEAGSRGDGADNTAFEWLDLDHTDLYPDQDSRPINEVAVPGGKQDYAANDQVTASHLLYGNKSFDDSYDPVQSIRQSVSLRDWLLEQSRQEFRDQHDRRIALVLVDELDEAGYLSAEIDEIAHRLGADRLRILSILARMRGFDPAGIFACSLADCFTLQLDRLGLLNQPMQILLANLRLFSSGDRKQLMRLCKVDSGQLDQLVRNLRRLDPKPGVWVEDQPPPTVIPDVIMRLDGQGGWRIELNEEILPSVQLDRSYYRRMRSLAGNPEERAYLSERWSNAGWYLRAIEQRGQTILKVAGAIMEHQSAFFLKGLAGLTPLIMRDIADRIGMHESTVSRATSNKYIETPRGVFELRFFFANTIPSAAGGEGHSSVSVRYQIKRLIREEAADSPLSDQGIMQLLRDEGILIARRTVTKYREAMHIGSSTERRRRKALMANQPGSGETGRSKKRKGKQGENAY